MSPIHWPVSSNTIAATAQRSADAPEGAPAATAESARNLPHQQLHTHQPCTLPGLCSSPHGGSLLGHLPCCCCHAPFPVGTLSQSAFPVNSGNSQPRGTFQPELNASTAKRSWCTRCECAAAAGGAALRLECINRAEGAALRLEFADRAKGAALRLEFVDGAEGAALRLECLDGAEAAALKFERGHSSCCAGERCAPGDARGHCE